jgi:serine/threonine-protein kinase
MSAPIETRCNTCGRPVNTADRYCGFCGARLDGENLTPTAETTGPHRPHVDRILASLRAATIGEYDIAGELGRGGMAVVFLAHELSLNRKVAIKALLPELLYTEGMDRRFKHEARIAAKLDHPNILVIHGVREATDLLFIVMKLVEGLPLSAILKGGAPLPIPVVRLILRNVADALSYAHGEGVVHRDVKPANIMVDRRGNVVVMDFGIAKAADDAHLTRTGLVIGTPAYMSPEQCLAQGVSAASDQYSLGVVAYELLTGRTPFRGSALEMQWAHATAAPPTVRSLRPDCPPELDAVVMRMMAKAPGERWSTLHDVSHALADDASTVKAARAALVALVNDAPDRRDATLPTTPASPVPIGPGPVAVGDATTDPVRATSAPPPTPSAPGAPNVAAAVSPLLTLSQERIELSTGDSVELMVELDANDQATDGTSVEWQSSNPGVALVSRDGFVTAVGPGLSEVVCTWRGRRAVCLVHVTAAAAALPATPLPPKQATPVAAAAGRGGPRRIWWIGALAASVAVFAVYRGMKPSDVIPPNVATPPEAPAPTRPLPVASVPAAAPPAGRTVADSIGSTAPKVASPRSDTASAKPPSTAVAQKGVAGARVVGPAGRTAVGSSSTATSPGARAAVPDPRAATATNQQSTPVPPVAPPTVPLARPDSVRLTSRVDTGAGYGASRTAPPTSSPTPASPAPAPARDTADDRIPPAPREIATALFKEFANAINARAYSRITGAYSQPNDPAAIKLWQDFLVFVRDYTPRATVRSTTVNESSNPPTITATIDFRWSSDAGFERTRAGTFVGIGVPIPGGWQLHRAHLERKFW